MFIYIFLASFRSQERANNHNDKGDKNINKAIGFMSKTTILFTRHTSLNFLSFWTWKQSLKIQLQENWPLYSDNLSKANLFP